MCAFWHPTCSHLTLLNFITMITFGGVLRFVIFCILLTIFVSDVFAFSPRHSISQSTDRPTRLQAKGRTTNEFRGQDQGTILLSRFSRPNFGTHVASCSLDTGATCWRIKWPASVKLELHRHALMTWCSVWCFLSSLQTHFNLCSCRTVGHKVSRPYVITCTFTILGILISTFLYRRQKIQDWIAINVAARALLLLLAH